MSKKWKYPQIVVLLVGCGIAAYSAIDFGRSSDYVEAYNGPFGPWKLRLAAARKARPGESLEIIAWVSSPVGRPSYERLLLRAADGAQATTEEIELKGTMLSRRASLTLPKDASGAWLLHARAELWDGREEQVAVSLAPLLGGTEAD